jgi:hypothetical protein
MEALYNLLSAIWIEVMINVLAIVCLGVAIVGGVYLLLNRLAHRAPPGRTGGA